MTAHVLRRGNTLLTKRAQRVTSIETVRPLVDQAWKTLEACKKLYAFARGVGLAAPQIGHLWRFSVIEHGGMRYTLINPRIVRRSKKRIQTREGCLSFFDVRGQTQRYAWVVVEYTGLDGTRHQLRASGDFAMLVQHELDHLNGVLYADRLAPGHRLYHVPGMPAMP